MNKMKVQSAMEYLMTYGWSILIIAIALVVLFELGIFNSNSLSGNGACVAQSGYLCSQVSLSTNGILSAKIGNDYGTITITGLTCTASTTVPTASSFNSITPVKISNGDIVPLTFYCPISSNTLGTAFNGKLWVVYTGGVSSQQVAEVGIVSVKSTISSSAPFQGILSGSYSVPITLTNQQSSGTQSNFQQMVYFSPSTYSSYENSNLSNIEFTSGSSLTNGGTPLYSWIESGASSSAANTVVWVNLGSTTLGAYENYISVNIINSQSTATGTNFQQMISFNALSYSNYEASDLGNIRFYYGNTELYSWCESGCTSTSSNAIFWINTNSLNIGANSYATVNMIFESTSTEYSGVHAGEAPQLSSTYAQYDNGAKVFNFYENFGGLSTLPSGWTSLTDTQIIYYPNYIEVGPDTTVGNWYGIYKSAPLTLTTVPNVFEFYGNMYDATTNAGLIVGLSTAPQGGTGNSAYGIAEGQASVPVGEIYITNNGNQFLVGGSTDSNTMKIYSISISSSTSESVSLNYGAPVVSSSTLTPATLSDLEIAPSNNGGGNPTSPVYIYWIRSRPYPPNGVMPTIQLSSVQSGDILSSNTGTIYMNFLSSNSPVSSGYTGYAPQLYCAGGCEQSSYAQYDNGGSVFSFYDVSPTGSKWTTYGSGQSVTTSANNGDYFKTTNALVTTLCGGGYTTNVDLNSISNGAIVTFWLYAGTSGNGGTLFFPSTSTGDSYGVGLGTGTGFETGVLSNNGGTVNPCDYAESTNGYYSQNTWYQNQLVLSGNTVSYYLQQSSSSTGIESFGTKIGSYQYSYTPSGNYVTIGSMYPNTGSAYFSGFVVRQYPPNGVMPEFNLGSVSS